jgi:GH15 family glucan-1,4-alpha-glucosidase
VKRGNRAKYQTQLSCYGDLLETASLFAKMGHVLDPAAAQLLVKIADQVVERWHLKDSGIWELPDEQHYTFSKVGCWLALDRAVKLAEDRHIDGARCAVWADKRDGIVAWIDDHCWSEAKQAYTFYPGTDRLDAALLLTTRFGFEHEDRLLRTRFAIEQELAVGPLVYRYSGAAKEEGAFVACSCWLVEAYAFLGEVDRAEQMLHDLLGPLGKTSAF